MEFWRNRSYISDIAPHSRGESSNRFWPMKLLTILALIAVSLMPVFPASAKPEESQCTVGSDSANNQSSLSSTSEGGLTTPCPH